ncbi:MAG: hydantoinase B/oxoprolinase family protein [Erythrobacter sp.]|nr:hydantoinase B/oxoprolinase family protein [Erythrobacter sp.]
MDDERGTADSGQWQFWIDRGGTFTDIVARKPDGVLLSRKYLSENPEQYEDAALYGMRQITGDRQLSFRTIRSLRMGTTVATNALLERKGEPTLLAITKGLGDAIEIGTQARPDTFALKIEKPAPIYADVIEIAERVRDDGSVETPLDGEQARLAFESAYASGLRAVAIVLMHAYLHPDHELELARIARETGFAQVSVSHEVSPLAKIVPRGETSIVDAYLTPILRRYIERVSTGFNDSKAPGQLLFMQSSGGLTDADRFRGRDAILSGPAGGVVGSVETARRAGFEKVIGFDMGGTSTDVSHYAGQLERVYETEVAGAKMRVPMLHIHTVAAGGGSILRYEDGRLRVGPESAGADPGPVCYRRGGPLAVTDINVCLGKLRPEHFPAIFGPEQSQRLDVEASRAAFAEIATELDDDRAPEDVAEGFLAIANEHMAQAIKQISTARGHDVKDYALNCFGGAGGQHACLVAERVGISKILVHPLAGVLSAYGMGLAKTEVQRQKVMDAPLTETLLDRVRDEVSELRAGTEGELGEQGIAPGDVTHKASALMRYARTETAIKVPLAEAREMAIAFENRHREQFGFAAPDKVLLLDTLILESETGGSEHSRLPFAEATSTAPVALETVNVYSRGAWREAELHDREELCPGHRISGPAIIVEKTGTTIVEPGWQAMVDRELCLVLTQSSALVSPQGRSTAFDPVTLEIFANLFMSIAEQMGIVLRNTAQSVNVKERLDFSCAIFDATGNLIANAPHVPVHLGSMDASVKTIIESGATIEPGDAFVHNNPHKGGSHLPDVTVVSPVFDEKKTAVLFYVASRAHHEDIGGISPGSMSPLGRSIEDEGILLDNVKLVEAGEFQSERIERILGAGANPARNIAQNVADLMAQVAANSAGAGELRKLVGQYGLAVVHAYMDHIQDAAEAAVRRVVSGLDEGAFRLELDSGAAIQVAIRPDRDSGTAIVDFTGTSSQQDSAFNAPPAVTRAAVLYVFRCLIGDDIPLNAGCMKPLSIIVPKGSMLNPDADAAVVAGNVETSQAITDALFAALGRLGTSQGTMNNLTFGNSQRQYYETICSGAPAGPGFDGVAAVHTHMTNTRMTDPEVLEHRYPVVLDEFRIDRGSGGVGRWKAGDGVTRAIRFLEPMEVSILSEHRRTSPVGLQGANAGRLGKNWIERFDGKTEKLAGCDQAKVGVGDRIVIRTPTGGGYGEEKT